MHEVQMRDVKHLFSALPSSSLLPQGKGARSADEGVNTSLNVVDLFKPLTRRYALCSGQVNPDTYPKGEQYSSSN